VVHAMALTATLHRLRIELSDVERGVYESLDLRVARHPSESMRYMLTRLLAYCLSYAEGIAFSKAGIASTDDPPICVRDPTGLLLAWIDVGSPSAERLHRAAKAARQVALYSCTPLAQLQREFGSRPIHHSDSIELWHLEPAFLDALAPHIDRNTKLELVRNEGQLYVTIGDNVLEGTLTRAPLLAT